MENHNQPIELNPDGNHRSLEEILKDIVQEGFFAFCGAGISIPPPSCAPSWWSFTEELLLSFFGQVPNDWGIPEDFKLKASSRQPEEVFENFSSILESKFFSVFEALNVASPNNIHLILAKLAKAKILKGCITTNFDIYIEQALRQEGVEYELLVENYEFEEYINNNIKNGVIDQNKFILCKIHGTTERPNTIVAVASAYKMSKGFSEPKAKLFRTLLSKYPCLYLGYSGWDYNHINYQRFWENAGSLIKKIIWNRRPNEKGGPDFNLIFKKCRDRFEFCEGELPDALVTFLENTNIENIRMEGLNPIFTDIQENVEMAKKERIEFLDKWISTLPDSHKLGLVITESSQFSERFQDFMKVTKEITSNTEGVTYDFAKVMQDLGAKFSNKEITMEEYTQKIFEIQLKTLMQSIKKDYHEDIFKAIRENKYPGITDNSMSTSQFLTYVTQFSKWYNIDEAMDIAADYHMKIMYLSSQTDPDSNAERDIQSRIVALQRPDEKMWKPALEEMKAIKELLLKGEIDQNKFSEEIGEIQNQWLNKQMGRDVDVDILLDKQIDITAKSTDKEAFEEQCEALSLTTMIMTGSIFTDVPNSNEYHELMKMLSIEEQQKDKKLALIKDVFAYFFDRFQPIIDKAEQFRGNTIYLINIAILSAMVGKFQYSGTDEQNLEYRNKWDNGEYPGYTCEVDIYNYIRDWTNSWIKAALNSLPPRFIQKLCGYLIMLASMGKDFELCKQATEISLNISEGKITELTPQGIPSALAAFYEERNDLQQAMKYYNLNLDAIKLITAPLWGDTIVYRAALLHFKLGYKAKALEIIGKYHPDFYGNQGVIAMPARKLAKQLAEGIANELGYSSAKEAIDTILQ
ncbi:MAG: SIR2 family protein [Candidatus Lokiarchaeota archaeon]|nr:SIR2 family protein [Candidatus Lokiarchaeota archaeon]